MEEPSDDKTSADMASRIEKTLAERELERMRELPVAIESADTEPSRGTSPFSYLMLLLGVVAGAMIGAALYFMLPAPGASRTADLQQQEMSGGLEEADRLLASGERELARKAYLALIAKGASSPGPYNNLASLYAAEGDLDQAQVLLKKALETDPDYLAVYHNVGMVYAAMARDSYGKALQLSGEVKPLRLQRLGRVRESPLVAQVLKSDDEIKAPAIQPVAKVEMPVPSTTEKVEEVSPSVESEVLSVVEPVADKTSVVDETSVNSGLAVVATEVLVAQDLAISDPSADVSPRQFLKQWAQAWSSQDVDAYLRSYASDYVPGGGVSYKSWQEKRRQRLTAPTFIEIELDAIEVINETGESVKVEAVQAYRSDRYQDRTRKSFVLRRSEQAWVITEERSLGRVR
jgi:tetratricopeptide (TPR) repeat protein